MTTWVLGEQRPLVKYAKADARTMTMMRKGLTVMWFLMKKKIILPKNTVTFHFVVRLLRNV